MYFTHVSSTNHFKYDEIAQVYCYEGRQIFRIYSARFTWFRTISLFLIIFIFILECIVRSSNLSSDFSVKLSDIQGNIYYEIVLSPLVNCTLQRSRIAYLFRQYYFSNQPITRHNIVGPIIKERYSLLFLCLSFIPRSARHRTLISSLLVPVVIT